MIDQGSLRSAGGIGEISDNGCIACRGSLSFLGEKSRYSYHVCQSCKTVQIYPVPSRSDVEDAYADSQYATAAHGQRDADEIRKSSRPYYTSLAATLRDHGVSGLIVDYGAGWGGLCELLIKDGFNCRGIELARNMVDECRRRALPVDQKTLEALAKEGQKAGAIVLCGVFEHLLDPKSFLESAFDALEGGGLLVSLQPTSLFARILASVLRIGSSRKQLPSFFWVFDPPWHVALYSVKGMKTIAKENGFDLMEIRFAPQGRVQGLYGVAQRLLECVNRVGWGIFHEAWPLMISHIYVFRKNVQRYESVSR